MKIETNYLFMFFIIFIYAQLHVKYIDLYPTQVITVR